MNDLIYDNGKMRPMTKEEKENRAAVEREHGLKPTPEERLQKLEKDQEDQWLAMAEMTFGGGELVRVFV